MKKHLLLILSATVFTVKLRTALLCPHGVLLYVEQIIRFCIGMVHIANLHIGDLVDYPSIT
jgi:hypothetical protein